MALTNLVPQSEECPEVELALLCQRGLSGRSSAGGPHEAMATSSAPWGVRARLEAEKYFTISSAKTTVSCLYGEASNVSDVLCCVLDTASVKENSGI